MKTVVIYGGMFNPPTIAHQKILQAAIDWACLHGDDAEVWLLPSGENNKKKTGIPRSKRLSYCEALVASVESRNLVVSIELFEFNSSEYTDKIATVKAFSSKYPDVQFWWLYGADSIMTIDNWGGSWLKQNTKMLIAPRDGASSIEIPTRSEILDIDTLGCLSSTAVRELIEHGGSYELHVPTLVVPLIDREEVCVKDEKIA